MPCPRLPADGGVRRSAEMKSELPRREFLKTLGALAATAALPATLSAATSPAARPAPTAAKLPRWRGFNLLEKFIAQWMNEPFREADFEWMANWGFDFARLPMSYHCWSSPTDWKRMDEKVLKEVDRAVEYGRQYGIHVSINFHRTPGYSVDTSKAEPFNLWKDAEALEATSYHWAHFARRYKGIPSSQLSFDLFNEPATFTAEPQVLLSDAQYAPIARAVAKAIRAEDPQRLIISDGLLWGNVPVPSLADAGMAQSTRGYSPHYVSHYRADWVKGSDQMREPTWPMTLTEKEVTEQRQQIEGLKHTFADNPLVTKALERVDPAMPWGRERYRLQQIEPWKGLEALGVGVHVGECGVYNKTPHRVALAYLKDLTDLWREAGWGFAVWNFRGDFGLLDSGRADVKYENFRGHKLDREMLELLRHA